MLGLNYTLNDGTTHLNVDPEAKTELGRALVVKLDQPFVHPKLGEFNSIEGMLEWVKHKGRDERFRTMSISSLRRYVSNYPVEFLQNFDDVIVDAWYWKLRHYPHLFELMRKNTLPFERYYIQTTPKGKLVVRTKANERTIRQLNTLQRLVTNGVESDVDYSFLIE